MNDELKFKIREIFNEYKLLLRYLIREPYYELKRILNGTYNSALLFWVSIMAYVILWRHGIGGIRLKLAGLLIIVCYIYMFKRSEKYKEYYTTQYIEGKKLF